MPGLAASALEREQQGASVEAPCCCLQPSPCPTMPLMASPRYNVPRCAWPYRIKPCPPMKAAGKARRPSVLPSQPSPRLASPCRARLCHVRPDPATPERAALGLTPSSDAQRISPPPPAVDLVARRQASPQPQTGRAWAANRQSPPACRRRSRSPQRPAC